MDNRNLSSVKVFQILLVMPPETLRRLEDFVASPYFNVRAQLRQLFGILLRAMSREEAAFTLRSSVYFELFEAGVNGGDYTDKMDSHLRKLLSDLRIHVDQFLAIEGFVSNPSQGDVHISEAYLRMGLERHFELKISSAIGSLPMERASSTTLLRRHELETMRYQHQVSQRQWDGIKELPGGALVVHFHIERYKQLCEQVIFNRVLKRENISTFGDTIPSVLSFDMLEAHPIAKFYALFYQLLVHEKGDFDELRVLTLDTCMEIDREECKQMFNYLQNYCSGKVHDGEPYWQKQLLGVYLDRLTFDEVVMPQDLMNMVTVAVREKDLDAAHRLFESGLSKLKGDGDGLTARYLECYLWYAEGRYSDARKGIQGLHSVDPWLDLSIRTLEVKAWWEDAGEHTDFLLSRINNLIRHLQREVNLPASRKRIQIMRFRVAARIVRARGNRAALAKVEKDILSNERLFDRLYLLERCRAYQAEWCVGD